MVDFMPVAILVLCDNDQAAAYFEDTIESAVLVEFKVVLVESGNTSLLLFMWSNEFDRYTT